MKYFVQKCDDDGVIDVDILGPFTAAELQNMALRGQLQRSDLVAESSTGSPTQIESGDWQEARHIPALFSLVAIDCPHCGMHLKVPARDAGKPKRCPKCGSLFKIPTAFLDADAAGETPPGGWYFQLMGETFGPMSFAKLQREAQAGSLAPDCLVKKDSDEDWVLADSIDGLFSPPRPSRTKRASKTCPFCGAQIFTKATACKRCRKLMEEEHAAPEPPPARTGAQISFAAEALFHCLCKSTNDWYNQQVELDEAFAPAEVVDVYLACAVLASEAFCGFNEQAMLLFRRELTEAWRRAMDAAIINGWVEFNGSASTERKPANADAGRGRITAALLGAAAGAAAGTLFGLFLGNLGEDE